MAFTSFDLDKDEEESDEINFEALNNFEATVKTFPKSNFSMFYILTKGWRD